MNKSKRFQCIYGFKKCDLILFLTFPTVSSSGVNETVFEYGIIILESDIIQKDMNQIMKIICLKMKWNMKIF